MEDLGLPSFCDATERRILFNEFRDDCVRSKKRRNRHYSALDAKSLTKNDLNYLRDSMRMEKDYYLSEQDGKIEAMSYARNQSANVNCVPDDDDDE